jgi:nucleoside-triphosphatase
LKIFLTGPPGVRKSIVLQKVKEALVQKRLHVGGVYRPEVRERGVRVGFEIIDLCSQAHGILASIHLQGCNRIGRHVVNLDDLTHIGVNALETAMTTTDVIFLDEVGPMEMQGRDFQEAVLRIVASSKPIIGIIHYRMQHPIVEAIKKRNDVNIIEVTLQNRVTLQSDILERLKEDLQEAIP